MVKDHEDPATASIELWDHELPDGSSLSTGMDRVNATCTDSKPLSADTSSFPTRSFGLTGSLSLHDYRKHLAQAAEYNDDPVDRSEKTLKRKTGTSNLNRPPDISTLSSYAVSISSSGASSPPPLSPSCSHSVISQRSELDEVSDLTLDQLQLGAHPVQGPRVDLVSENLVRPRPNRKRLNTFRQKLEARGQIQHSPLSRPQDSEMLATTQAAATISHGGASFEILNPRKSLDLARIVSFIEDVDTCSLMSADQIRDSMVSSFTIDQGLDRSSLSQFTDASLPSHYSSSLYTSLSTAYSTPKMQSADIPSSSPGVHDRIHSLSDFSLHEHNYWTSDSYHEPEQQIKYDDDIPGESSRAHMVSISERQESREDLPSEPDSPRPSSSSVPTYYSGESEIGEPGSPVYANGEWSQVDERDRGIFLDLPSPTYSTFESKPPSPPLSPYDTYLANTMSPAYSQTYDPYDPIYFDPHVQSVLAAANAENMGLRGSPPGALDDLQRRFQNSRSLSGDGTRKGDNGKQRKKLRKFFSWRSGN
ncbi:uncharacterized protein N7483_005299 [Penicillium malachiteum]|uniref:uncharacterized protein n=1 Tax=Penicillium malachiteum TaxID=1324776 RepID=UPI00254918BA|nr:uncharacterized protein N7483_005299 [Penicillium malachiteum]KAJ5730791.1 hypothetical protein N7483_005299 [Penicillium malachiteum]